MLFHIPQTNPLRRIRRILELPLLALIIFALIPFWTAAQPGAPPHATPAPNTPEGAPVTVPPPNLNQPQPVPAPAIRNVPPPNLAPGAAPVPGGTTARGAAPGRGAAPAPGGALTPANAPQVLFESAPTTQGLRGTGGALPEKEGEPLPSAEPEQPHVKLIKKRNIVIDDLFKLVRDQTGVQVKAVGAVVGKVIPIADYSDKSVESILEALTVPNNWRWAQLEDGSYEVMTQEDFNKFMGTLTRIKVFQLHFIDAEELLKVVQPLLTPEIGAVAADARSNKLIVTDLPGKIGLVESIIREYDVQVYTQVFEIKNAAIDTIKEQLDTLKSKAGEMYIDNINRVIIVKDTLDKIKQMDQLVQILDRDVITKVYNMVNVGTENDFAETLVSDFLEPLKSKDDTSVMKYNKDTGKLYVRDIRSVHEKIEQTLRRLDTPRKQVRIEGEIVSVGVSNDLTLGTEWIFSHDLKKSFGNPLTGLGTETGFNTSGLPLVTVGKGGLSVLELTDDFKAQLTATLSDSRTRLLLRPRITIANNETGTIQVTRNEPILQTYNYGYNSGGTNAFNGGASSGQSEYMTGLAVMLKVAISNRGLVEIQVQIQNTTPIIVPDIGNGVRGVGSSGETAETMLIIPSGETRVIGGLISSDNSEGQSGVPILSQLPWVGFLFGQKTKTSTLRNLMFFITPTIVEEQPLNDLVVEAVNPLAEAEMRPAPQSAAPAAQIGEIPPELRPYLREIQPEPIPLPEGGLTSGTTRRSLPDSGLTSATEPLAQVSDENDISTASASTGAKFLTSEPYATQTTGPRELRTGGAIPQAGPNRGAAGPSGIFGGGVAGAAATPGRGAGAAGAGAARPAIPGARGAAGARPTPRPSSTGRSGRLGGAQGTQGMRGGMGGGMGSFRSETGY